MKIVQYITDIDFHYIKQDQLESASDTRCIAIYTEDSVLRMQKTYPHLKYHKVEMKISEKPYEVNKQH